MEYEISEGKWGSKLILKASWKNSFYKIIKGENITELILNYANGWKGDNITFIETLANLKGIGVTDWNIIDITPLNKLHNLRSLNISTYCKTEINFKNFPHLEEASLHWRSKAKSIYECPTLKDVFIYGYTGSDLTPFNNLINLNSFRMKPTRIKQLGDFNPPTIEELHIGFGRGFSSLEGLEKLTTLKKLAITTCRKIKSIEEIQDLKELERLELWNNGKIASLYPLRNLKKLKEFYFSESTEIEDGDLSVLDQLPLLEKVSFQERKHYNRTWKDFGINQ